MYTDLENGTRTLLVLANDIRSRYGDIRVVSVTPGSAGGTTRPAADGQAVIYTPRNASFSGSETFSYTIEDQKTPIPNRSTAIVTVTVLPGVVLPQAIDDSASFLAGSTNSSLSIDVLRNDFTGKSPPIGIVPFTQPFVGQGSVQLNDQGTPDPADDRLVFTRVTGQTQPAQFNYTIEDINGVTSEATVTVHMTDLQQLDDVVRYRLKTTDLAGNTITAIAPGQEFNLVVMVKDLRTNDGTPPPTDKLGVFAGYLDVLYDYRMVSRVGDVQFSSFYNNFTTQDLEFEGIVNETGAVQKDPLTTPLGPGEFELFRVRMRADAPGLTTFKGDPADETTEAGVEPLHDTLLFERVQAVPPPPPANVVPLREIFYQNSDLQIVTSGLAVAIDDFHAVDAGSSSTNPKNLIDVLKNDPNNNRLIIIGTSGFTDGGSASISTDGKTLRYQPRLSPVFQGTEQFTYTVRNLDTLLTASATVTVKVGNVTPDVGFSFEIRDENGVLIRPFRRVRFR